MIDFFDRVDLAEVRRGYSRFDRVVWSDPFDDKNAKDTERDIQVIEMHLFDKNEEKHAFFLLSTDGWKLQISHQFLRITEHLQFSR